MKSMLRSASSGSRVHQASSIERLEPRVAPAVVILNPHTATFTDIDGDHVTITVSKGTLTVANLLTAAKLQGDQLQLIDFSSGGFDDANLTVSVKRAPEGDGLAHIGYVNSTGHDLGAITIRGDLGQIDAGDANTSGGAIKSLSVQSMGRFGLDTQAGIGSLQSDIDGRLGKLNVSGDFTGAFISVSGGADGKIGSITIGGSFIGGSLIGAVALNSGVIRSQGDIGPVTIAHDLLGGSGDNSGSINTQGKLASVTIGGSLVGGSGSGSGSISCDSDMGRLKIAGDLQGDSGSFSGFVSTQGKLASVSIGGSVIGGSGFTSGQVFSDSDMGPVKIGHQLQGGSGNFSGLIEADGTLASLSIGGSLVGGSGASSGKIFSSNGMGPLKLGSDQQGGSGSGSGSIETGGKLASVTIGGSLIGGSGTASGSIFSREMGLLKIRGNLKGGSITGDASLDGSAFIRSDGRIAGVSIGGSIISGIDTSTGTLTNNASIRAGDDIGFIAVKGSIVGHNFDEDSPVIISARGQNAPSAKSDMAIGRITVGGHVEFAQILAGYDIGLTAVNGNASIGSVKVGGDWVASDLVAGVTAGADGDFGTSDDTAIGGTLVAKISSILIGGQVTGTSFRIRPADHFGFVAETIASFKAGQFKAALNSGSGDIVELSLTTGDATLREV
ncbi:hypothetical protein ACXR0O_20865 [Verrucomicrobiota bacterium sgz303538]